MKTQLFLLAAALALLSPATLAQKDSDALGPDPQIVSAVAMMHRGQWQEARATFEQVINEWSNDARYATYPPFGTVYYNKGFCEMKLKLYDNAIESFQTCHQKYPSKASSGKAQAASDGEERTGTNVYWKLAVFQWAAALQAKGKYDDALKIYQKFLDLKPDPREDQFNPGVLYCNMASCHAKRAKVDEAEAAMAKAFERMDNGGVPQQNLWQAFLDVLDAHLLQKKDKGAQALAFVQKYAPYLAGEPLVTGYYAPRLLKTAQEAGDSDKTDIALRLYSLLPKTSEILQAGMHGDPKRMGPASRQVYDTWKKKADEGEPWDINAYFGVAKAHEVHGNDRAGFAIFDHMARVYPKTKHRPQILYAAAKTASNIGEMGHVQEHGLAFLKEFPNHELKPSVSALLLSSLFYNGEYEDCLRIAGDVRKNMTIGANERDLPDFVYGGSLYYLGRHPEAQPELDSHVKSYLQSPYRENVTYYQASNLTKLFEWVKASELLDVWLKTYEPKDSPLLDVAYLDRASCYFALSTPSNEGNKKALELCEKIISKFPGSQVLDRTHNLRGDVLQSDRKLPASEESYLKGLSLAEEAEHEVAAATSLMQLVTICSQQEKFKEAIAHYDRFFQKYSHTYATPFVAIGGLTAFQKAEPARLDGAMKRVQEIIASQGDGKDSSTMEQTLASYTSFLLREKDPKEVISILDNFPKDYTNRSLHAWLLISKIGIIEERLAKDEVMAARAKVYYEELQGFDKKDLGDFILYRLGAKIAQTNPFRAKTWFEPLRQSNDPDLRVRAELEISRIDAGSSDDAAKNQAVDNLKRLRGNNAQNAQVAGPATLALARLFHERKQWKEANEEWKAYMTEKRYSEARAEAQFKLGESYERLGKRSEAIVAYNQIVVLFASLLEYSGEAALRICNLLYEQGKKVDAYKYANLMYYRMSQNKHPKVDELDLARQRYMSELKAAGEWKAEYEKDLRKMDESALGNKKGAK